MGGKRGRKGMGGWKFGFPGFVAGTIVVLFRKPGLNGDAYYTQKGNYGLNVQVQIYTPSLQKTLRLTLYRLGIHPPIFECGLLTWVNRLCSWCSCFPTYHHCQASWNPLWGRGICMDRFSIHSELPNYSSPQMSSLTWALYGSFEGMVSDSSWTSGEHQLKSRSHQSPSLGYCCNNFAQSYHQCWRKHLRCWICSRSWASRGIRGPWRLWWTTRWWWSPRNSEMTSIDSWINCTSCRVIIKINVL